VRPTRPGFGPEFGPEFGSGPGPSGGPRHRMHHMHRPMGGPGPRSFERGGIKFAILGLLKDKPRHGYDIIREMEERSGGFYSPSPGAVYPTLQALEDQGLVTSTTEDGKKVYQLTDAGLAFLEEHKERAGRHQDRWEAQWGSGTRGEGWEAVNDIRDSLGDVRRAVRRSAGDSAKLKEIGEVLEEAAAKIREIAKR
jgi:DNA-binding PadR family transcriptional regulator